MATSLLDVRDPLAPAAAGQAAPRRRPVGVVVLGAGGMLQAVALVAVALTSLTGMLAAEHRAPDAVIAAGLLGLAGWTVLSAARGAAVLDGGGRQLLLGVASASWSSSPGCFLAAATSLPDPAPGNLPLPGARPARAGRAARPAAARRLPVAQRLDRRRSPHPRPPRRPGEPHTAGCAGRERSPSSAWPWAAWRSLGPHGRRRRRPPAPGPPPPPPTAAGREPGWTAPHLGSDL